MPTALAVCTLVAAVGVDARAESAAVAPVMAAQVSEGGIVRAIRVEGKQRIEESTIRSYLAMQPGDSFSPEKLDQSLKALFATGLFADVALRREGDDLVVRVVENPIINRIAFEGAKRLKEDQLLSELQLRPRVVFTRTRVQNDVQRILDLYRRNGRFAATVEPKVIQLDQNRVDLVFEIDEGARTEVERINFVGNDKFSRTTLLGQLQTKESHWYRFLSSDDTYDPDRLNYDKELLRKYYLGQGYADFRVVSAVAELTPERDAFYITFTVEEGERYQFGKVNLTTTLKNLDPELLRGKISFSEGDWYDANEVEKTITELTTALGEMQYAFVDIRPRVDRHRDEHTIDLTFEINEGPRVYVERIDITGNVRTLDRVVRRELTVAEGDPFNNAKLKRSEERVKNLNFFEKVRVTTTEGTQPDQTVVQVDVTEQSTGEVSLGAGFSTTDGALGDFSISERNLLGTGRQLRFGAMISQRTQQYDVSFTEPYFLNRDLSAGVDLFRTVRDNQTYSSYSETDTGFGFNFGYPLTENLRQRLRYSMQQTSISDIPFGASRYIKDQEGTRSVSMIGQELIYDRRNSKIDPSSGYVMKLSTDLAGLGGSANFVRTRGSGTYYQTVPGWDRWVASVGGEAGYVASLDKTVFIADRFFIGGDTLRGFRIAGIGARDITTGDALGGTQFYRGTVELRFPLGLPEELGLSGHAFTDAGTLTGSGVTDPNVKDIGSIRAAGGLGLQWRSPMGPVGVDFAIPIAKQSYDKVENFRFNFGTRF
ncbi:MAG: outer membrane protein assembly factor BamA [Rhodospirillaceae bacterium]